MNTKNASFAWAAAWLFSLCAPTVAQAQTAWDQFQGDAQHTGYSNVQVQNSFAKAWSLSLGANALNPVVADAGKVFVTGTGYFNGQYLYALNAADGGQVWSQNFGSVFSLNPPSYSNGTVYVQSGKGDTGSPYFRGLDANTGAVTLQTTFSAQWERYQAPTIYNGVAYMNAGYYGGAQAVDLKTGTTKWAVGLEQYDGWTPAVNDKYVVTYTGGVLRTLNPTTGATISSITNPGFNWSGYESATPTLSGNHAYVAGTGNLTSFNLDTGTVDWMQSGVGGQIAINGSEIFAIRDGALVSLNAQTGSTNWLWSNLLDSGLSFNLIATANDVFVSGAHGTYVIDRATHTTVATLDATGWLSLGNDQLYVAGSTGTLTAYNLSVTAVPEPASAALLGVGLLVLRRRRRVRA